MTTSISSDFDRRQDVLTTVANRLTRRDMWMLTLVHEHRVLTTNQLASLAFTSTNAAQHRLLILYRMGIIDRFRPLRTTGRAPFHYTIGPVGIAFLASNHNLDPNVLKRQRERVLAAAQSPLLSHTVGVNGFFADLSSIHRSHPTTRLIDWWSERRCIREWGQDLRPDGYGVLQDGDAQLPFFLEYDRGTETIERVAAKLNGYRSFAFGTVLFWFLTKRRERNFLNRCKRISVPFASANRQDGTPVDRIWHSVTFPEEERTLRNVLDNSRSAAAQPPHPPR